MQESQVTGEHAREGDIGAPHSSSLFLLPNCHLGKKFCCTTCSHHHTLPCTGPKTMELTMNGNF